MPYIAQDRRRAMDVKHRDDITEYDRRPRSTGELNYAITKLCLGFVRRNQVVGDVQSGQPTYQDINDVVGALEGVKLEFYRRLAAPYEDTKIALNGDVY